MNIKEYVLATFSANAPWPESANPTPADRNLDPNRPTSPPVFARGPLPSPFALNAAEPHSGSEPLSILLVEDNVGDVSLIRETLWEHSIRCNLVVADDGEMAFRKIEEIESQSLACPDLLILDLNLPKRNGREVLQRVRDSAVCKDVPTVILTSSNAARDRYEVAQLGAACFIRKPAHLDEFLQIGAQFKEILTKNAAAKDQAKNR